MPSMGKMHFYNFDDGTIQAGTTIHKRKADQVVNKGGMTESDQG